MGTLWLTQILANHHCGGILHPIQIQIPERVSILIMAFLPPPSMSIDLCFINGHQHPWFGLQEVSYPFLAHGHILLHSGVHQQDRAASTIWSLQPCLRKSCFIGHLQCCSPPSWLNSDSSFLFAAEIDWLTFPKSAKVSLVSASSCSAERLWLWSEVSRRARPS